MCRELRQLHLDLLASAKFRTELTTFAVSAAIAAMSEVEGLEGSALIAPSSVSMDDLTALDSVGKSLLAELTSVVASLLILVSCALRPLTPPLAVALGRSLIEFSRLERLSQYAGLPPQLAAASIAAAKAIATAARPERISRAMFASSPGRDGRDCIG